MPEVLLKDIGEKDLVGEISKIVLPSEKLIGGLGHDSAFIDEPFAADEVLLMNTDRSGMNLAYKLGLADGHCVGDFAVSHAVSDIYASGGRPVAIAVALLLPPDSTVNFVKEVMAGADAVATQYGAFIACGDTKSAEKFAMVVTAIGKAKKSRILTRSLAQAGDVIIAVGWFGVMLAGSIAFRNRLALTSAARELFVRAITFQHPPYRVSQSVAERGLAHACTDNSDGLSGSIHSLCENSGVGAVIDAAKVPLHPEAVKVAEKMKIDPFQLVLGSGDWQHIYAVPQEKVEEFLAIADEFNTKASVIGQFTKAKEVILRKDSRYHRFLCLQNDRFKVGERRGLSCYLPPRFVILERM